MMKKRTEKLVDILKRFKLQNITLSNNSIGISITYTNWDAEAAWVLYVELLTRITTQPLEEETGLEKSALDSIYSIFQTTRSILKERGKDAKGFSRIAIIVLNKLVRPFTSKWHRLSESGAFENAEKCSEFRKELETLRINLVSYTKLLADMAGVEDLTDCEL